MKDEIICLYVGDMLQYLPDHGSLRNFTDAVGPWVFISFLSCLLASSSLVPLVPQSHRHNVGGVLNQRDTWQQPNGAQLRGPPRRCPGKSGGHMLSSAPC